MKVYIRYSLIAWILFASLVGWVVFAMSDLPTAVIRVSSFLLPQLALFYGNLIWLSCRYLEQRKKRTYFLLLGSLIAIHVIAFGFLDIYLDKTMPFDLPHMQERPVFVIFFGRFMASVPPLIISALLWKSYQLQKQKEESMELKTRMLQAETRALKAQINPHFLFNSMNNIYSLSQMKSDKTGDAILQLSEIMRFVTYESEKDTVSLKDEMKQIHNFIQLQFLKDENQENVKITLVNPPDHLRIAPMLLLPFIENTFKHSNFEDKEKGWISIQFHLEGNKLIMDLSNSASLKTTKKDPTGGVGMENVKKRLSLIYPDKHQLIIKQDTTTYNVKLELDLS